MRERQPDSREKYLSFVSKMVILLCGPNALTREVTEGILDRKEEIIHSGFGGSVIKIAEKKAEYVKQGILKNATRDQIGEVHSIASMIIDIKRMSQVGYEKTLAQIRNSAAKSYKTANKNKP
jgi:hypothetical protein